MNELIVGIDLGTTNSEIAVPIDGRIEVIEMDHGRMLPSVVGIDDDGQLVVGTKARNQYALHPERTVKSIKRKMGSDEKIVLHETEYSPQEISAMILRDLKQRAETYLEQPVKKAVITVPAYFSDAQRQATRDAGEIAGLEVVRIINEPTAACLAFEHEEPDARKTVMAFDFGGGTFDVSIVKMDGEMVEVEGSHGDTHLGGDDIDQLLYDDLLHRLHQAYSDKTFKLNAVSRNRLLRAAENAKIRLSENDAVKIIEDNLQTESGDTVHLEIEMTQFRLEEIIAGLLQKTLNSVHEALAEADVNIGQIDEILLVGGSTRIPAVAQRLENEFGRRPRMDIHPDLAVVYGAGVMAARTLGCDDQRILVDITPYTFGTSAIGMLRGETVPHLFCPLIHSGTPLPATRSRTFFTSYPGQEEVRVTAFQGEDEDARENILLGEFTVGGLDENAPANSEIAIRMSLDLDGILHVQAAEKATGLSKDIRIENSLGKLSDNDIKAARRRVAELFDENPDPEEVERDPAGSDYGTVHALIERTRKLMSDMDDIDRNDADALIKQLESDINNQVPVDEMRAAIDELEDLLFYLDTSK